MYQSDHCLKRNQQNCKHINKFQASLESENANYFGSILPAAASPGDGDVESRYLPPKNTGGEGWKSETGVTHLTQKAGSRPNS